MNNYKTFSYYLLELLKLITFVAVLAWLCSCNNNRERAIRLIHAYTDTVVHAARQRLIAQWAMDSIQREYTNKFPVRYFTPAQYKARERYSELESAAYKEMISAHTEFKIKKILAEAKVAEYTRKIDSLKIEIYR